MAEEKEPMNGTGKQAFDIEHNVPPKAQPELDSRGLKRSDMENYDEDGHIARKGGWVTAYANIVTAVIGSGVLSLAWSMIWLGWPAGALCIFFFAWVTLYCSELLIDAYRWPDVDSSQRNYTYIEAVTRYLGKEYAIFCGIIQYLNMFATGVGYTLTAGVALTAVQKAGCYHFSASTKDAPDPNHPCTFSQTPWIIFMGALQLVFSQIQDIDRIWIMSVLATIMSFLYSFIGLGLSIAKATEHTNGTGTADGLWEGKSPADKMWGIFQALGSIAFAYSFSFILIEITDTLKSPGEVANMKQATRLGISTTTFFYASIGFIGYAAFGNGAPGNLISGFGFYEPYWLVDVANVAIFIHLLGAFQVWMQPLYSFVETSLYKRFPGQAWLQYDLYATKVPGLGILRLYPFRLVWRSITVVVITILALLLGNCFNDIIAFLGAIGFAPLTVFLPVQMHIVQKKVPTWSPKWCALQVLNVICWCVSIVAAIGSIEGIIVDTQGFAPFQTMA